MSVIFLLFSTMPGRALHATLTREREREGAHGMRTHRSHSAKVIEVLEVRSTAASTEEEGMAHAYSSRSPPFAFLLQGLGPTPSYERVGNLDWWCDSAQRPIGSPNTAAGSKRKPPATATRSARLSTITTAMGRVSGEPAAPSDPQVPAAAACTRTLPQG